ncbi:MAG: peptidyl-prolyl cis-trans isomerase [Verrucomicrobiota bacterium]|nr:peptidyl-prolyl cis-trans isomerase [Verrucomicrobiota bacterium]
MISWIQKYFQKHIKLVMLMMLFIIGLPMVFIYSQSSGLGSGDVRVREQKFFNVNLANPEQAQRVFGDGQLSAQLRLDYQAMQNLQAYALQRVAGLALADELKLPVPNAEQISAYTGRVPAFLDQQGQFDNSAYARFGDSIKSAQSPIKVADVTRVLRDDARLAELGKVLGGPGYVLPSDVKQQLARIDSTWTIQIAELDYAGFNPAINPTDAELQKFHDENAFRYEVPARPRLSVVEFKAASFAPPGAPTEEELRAFYNANRARFPAPADAEKKDAASLAAPDAATDDFPKVRAQVEASLRDLAARRLASEAANEVTVALYERRANLKPNSAELASFLAGINHPAVAIAPFAPDSPPADRPWLGSYAEAISKLSADRPVSDALPTPDGFVVLLWNESLPSYKPLFTDAKSRVLADYRENEKRRLFIERGAALKAKLQAAGTGFATAAEAEKLAVKSYANFTLRQPPQDLPPAAYTAFGSLEPGQVSDLMPSNDKGIVVYAQEKKLPDLSPANPRYAEVQQQLMAFAASTNENSHLGQLVETELGKTNPQALR